MKGLESLSMLLLKDDLYHKYLGYILSFVLLYSNSAMAVALVGSPSWHCIAETVGQEVV